MDGAEERACLPKPMPDSMLELRAKLDERGIEWHDYSDEREINEWAMRFYGVRIDGNGRGYNRIYRTRWNDGHRMYSAICGFGTDGNEYDLLELVVDASEPIGWLNADAVMRIMDET